MTFVVLSSFFVDWLAVGFEWRKIKPASKTLAMVMVIFWTLVGVRCSPDALIILLLLAQLFGLMGDIFLLFPDRWFFAGLGAFLLGHLSYGGLILLGIFSFAKMESTSNSLLVPMIISLLFWGMVLVIIYRIFKRENFINHTKGKLLWILVQVYCCVLSGVAALFVFWYFIQSEPEFQMVLLPVGGILFLLSDTLLAYNRFILPIPKGHLWIHITYHLAQFSLAAGFLAFLA